MATLADRLASLAVSMATLADRSASLAISMATLADRSASLPISMATLADRSASLTISMATLADRSACLAISMATLADRLGSPRAGWGNLCGERAEHSRDLGSEEDVAVPRPGDDDELPGRSGGLVERDSLLERDQVVHVPVDEELGSRDERDLLDRLP